MEEFSEYEQVDELIDFYAGLGVRIGRITQSLLTDANAVDRIMFYETLLGIELVAKLARQAILSYVDPQVDELDLTERLLDNRKSLD